MIIEDTEEARLFTDVNIFIVTEMDIYWNVQFLYNCFVNIFTISNSHHITAEAFYIQYTGCILLTNFINN